ncbi:hypothetical protein SAMN05720354_101106 [Nitrosospira sp. Nsp1]|nr:hypothetical protein SAMN05720354_101106 [Nitrosospira sp. Nsp1]
MSSGSYNSDLSRQPGCRASLATLRESFSASAADAELEPKKSLPGTRKRRLSVEKYRQVC